MSKVYTKTGDAGSTGLFGGSRIGKADLLVETYGTIDEGSSVLGIAKASISQVSMKAQLDAIQEDLFLAGAEVASDEKGRNQLIQKVEDKDVKRLEGWIDEYDRYLAPLRAFVHPGENLSSAYLHQARTILRRCERRLIALSDQQTIRPILLQYFNRVSDYCFTLARMVDQWDQIESIAAKALAAGLWVPEKMTLAFAQEIIAAGIEAAGETPVEFVLSVCDEGGNPVAEARMDQALLGSIAIARGKAFTAAALRLPTETVGELAQPGAMLYGIENTHPGKLVLFGGGIPIFHNERVIGALGVSGGTVEEDIAIAKTALSRIVGERSTNDGTNIKRD
jgi:ATP:cob(I)alamin adenosyltransferase